MTLIKQIVAFVAVALSTMAIAEASTAGPRPSPFPRLFATAPDGARIAYYPSRAKSGVPLIVISGGPGSDHRYMHAGGAFERLAATRQVVMFDQRATGSSAAAPEKPTVDIWVSDIEAIRRALGAERVDLLGHSFGGYLAMSYAVAYPERARSLILADSSHPDRDASIPLIDQLYPDRAERWRSLRGSLGKQFRAEEIALFFSMEFVDPRWLDRYLAHVRGLVYDIRVNDALRADMAQRDLGTKVGSIQSPALLIHGRFDGILAPANSWSLKQLLPNSRIEFFERSGHMPFIEEAELFVGRVNAFLSERDRRQ